MASHRKKRKRNVKHKKPTRDKKKVKKKVAKPKRRKPRLRPKKKASKPRPKLKKKHARPIPLRKRRGKFVVPSKGLEGPLEGKKVYSGTRVLRKRKYYSQWSKKDVFVYEVAWFSPSLLPKEETASATQSWLDRYSDKIYLWFKDKAPRQVVFCRYGVWLKNIRTGEIRKPFEQFAQLFEDLSGKDFAELIPVKYIDQNWLFMGLSLTCETAW